MRVITLFGMMLLAASAAMPASATNLVADRAETSKEGLKKMCAPLCLETVVTDDLVAVWMIDNTGKRDFLFHDEPDWSNETADRPAAQRQIRTFYRPVNRHTPEPNDASPCGDDGWGYKIGEEIFSATVFRQDVLTGTYLGVGRQIIIPGGKIEPKRTAIQPTPAAQNNAGCTTMRAAEPMQ
ncbi:hypothetical protein C7S18_19760 [Ahniella affigens]|uniref:DUF2147 domain-containing protein n=1 Tax=Ahniella affigens TaxID=2021234 RepID=A0A2P1PWP3_9GAMM|nr:hypothetical protein [Ahniella affigens]AVP99263.1 hypothetical protein C7S18_19760 [Ahniella affigens]